ncbi:MAG: hypothetical protein NC548_55785 [Lachnospiraceae bacterium]|nr:hypothetical protein [Lachnospiraceae bacterium]
MEALVSAPGAVERTARIFITPEDVGILLGCKQSKAYSIIKDVNECAKKKGKHPFPSGKANKYLFSDIYDIPIEEVDRVIIGKKEM